MTDTTSKTDQNEEEFPPHSPEEKSEAEHVQDPDDKYYNSVRTATYKRSDDRFHFFDFGHELLAAVEQEEFVTSPKSGDVSEMLVERPYGKHWTASILKLDKLKLWDRMDELVETKEAVEGHIIAQNRGGLSVDIGLRAFLPKSQVDIHRVDDFEPYIGLSGLFRVTKFNHDKGNVIVSRRSVLEEQRNENRADLIEKIEPGQEYEGVVRNVVQFGAFVDIGGVEGLLHSSNMSWGRLDNPGELFSPGDSVRVVVLDFDKKKDRLSLGRKQLLEDPWLGIEDRYAEGDVLQGKVVSLADFGAFVEVADGLEGLVHVTELAWLDRINHPKDVLSRGADLSVKVIGIDAENRRLSLSVKQLEQNPYVTLREKLSNGTKLKGTISSITDFGLFVQVFDKIDGLVHHSDLSWVDRGDDFQEEYKVGDEIEVVLLDIDAEAERVALGVKQLTDDPWDTAVSIAKPGEKIDVTITRTEDFGAFAKVCEGVEGLIHISELREDRVENVQAVVRVGQTVNVLVTAFDRGNERIGLSLWRDEIGGHTMTEYSDDEGATSTLGDLLRDRLGIAEEE